MCAAADVVVCHGGNGTIYQALSNGAPVIGLPEFHDQEFNMQRVEALGLGVKVGVRDSTAAGVARAVQKVLGDAGYRERVRRLQLHLATQQGPRDAARRIREFMGARQAAASGPTEPPSYAASLGMGGGRPAGR